MTDLLALSVFGVDWQFLKPFIVIGLAFGGVYALSGVGLVVLYRATGVLNLAFGAIGAAGALIAYYLINHTSCPEWLAFTVCVAVRRGRQPCLRHGVRPRLRAARPAREDDGHARARADPARADGLARPRRRSVRALPAATELAAPLRHPRDLGEPDADHLDRARVRDHRRRQHLPARDEARHGDARARQRPGDHRNAGRAGAPGRGRGLVRLRARLRRCRAAPPGPAHVARLLGSDVPRHRLARGGADRSAAIALGDAVRRPRRRPRAVGRSPLTPRSPRTARRRRSCSRSPRSSSSRGTASSRSRGPGPSRVDGGTDIRAQRRAAARAARHRAGDDRPRRASSPRCSSSRSSACLQFAGADWITTSRASRSTRSPRSASASSTAASG